MSASATADAPQDGGSLAAFTAILRNPNLRKIQLAWAGSNLGTWGFGVALGVYAFDQGGAAAVGFVALLRLLPAAVATPFASTLGDRYPRRVVMAISDLVRVVLLVAAAVVALVDGPAALVYLFTALGMVASTAFRPAQAALVPTLATTPQELTASNVVSSSIESLGMFVGPAIGAAILAVSGPAAVFFTAAAAFLWSAILVWRIRSDEDTGEHAEGGEAAPHVHHEASTPDEASASFLRQTWDGFALVAREPAPRLLVGTFGLQTLVAGSFIVFQVVIALQLLDKGESWVGVLGSAFGIGGIVGALVSGALVGKDRLALNFGAGLVFWGGPLVLIGLWPTPAVAVPAVAIMGFGNTVVDIAGMTLLQRAVPDDMIARVFGVLETTFYACIALGAALTPAIVSALGASTSLVVIGLFLPIVTVLIARNLRRLDRSVRAPTAEIALLRGISLFSPLSPPVVEHLAGRLKPYTLPAGARVFGQGDEGDLFYVVASGSVEIVRDGAVVATVGVGGSFGEIALLHEVPRQAGAVAVEETRLLALEGEDFVAAVTGHAGSAEAAEAVIRSYGPSGLSI